MINKAEKQGNIGKEKTYQNHQISMAPNNWGQENYEKGKEMWRGMTVERCVSFGFRAGRWPQADLPGYVYNQQKGWDVLWTPPCFIGRVEYSKKLNLESFALLLVYMYSVLWLQPWNLSMQIHAMAWDMWSGLISSLIAFCWIFWLLIGQILTHEVLICSL